MSLDEEVYVGVLGNLRTQKGNGEKVSMEVSNLIEKTGYVCANCLKGDCNDNRYGTTSVTCMDISKNRQNSQLTNNPLHSCSTYE